MRDYWQKKREHEVAKNQKVMKSLSDIDYSKLEARVLGMGNDRMEALGKHFHEAVIHGTSTGRWTGTHFEFIEQDKLLNKPENNMQAQQILNAVQEGKNVKTIGCVFIDTQYASGQQRVYTYKTWFTDHEVGDHVVVQASKGLKVVEIVEVHEQSQIDGTSTIGYKWIVDTVSTTRHYEATEFDAQAIDDINADLRKKESKKVTEQISDELRKRL